MDVELRHLRAFAAVADTLSFTAASRQLLITQPALTRTIQQLEGILDVTLLERTSRSVELTDVGRAFRTRIQGVLRDLDLATAEARGERELHIGFSWALPDPWAGEVIATFEETTGASGRLMRRDDIKAALRHGEVDVAFIRYAVDDPELTAITLFDEPRVAAVSSRSPLAERDRLPWNELSEHPIVINTQSGSTRPELWPAARRPERVVECDNYDEWITLIAAGKGVGATPLSASATHAHTGVVFVSLADAPPVSLNLVWPRRRTSALLRRFIEIAADQGRVPLT
ncbi:LysR family transcriptional regulator [Saccharopolyspora elongata]|uniref:LysR family transcriptional regulator n=1 Tax=Saccharopolyspora elongata TaxID=2530387 RepID=A0A4R4Y9Y2_9PSEU|nr:LysR family transcriptional regulator [Saccharopolyspora elongata]TDD41348.1 LysR family transcriptional regulator [Saccharopolyspora elongata]